MVTNNRYTTFLTPNMRSFVSLALQQKARAEEAKAILRAGTGRSPAVKGCLQAARKGGALCNVGILGRLGDLASIAEKYDVAISTACGFLDHIVVQTTAGAQRCIEYLRKNNLGRANFIALDKMKKGAHDRVVETPEGAIRLFDLIQPSNFAITPAVYLSVGNTLVAPDLDTATRWAFDFGKRWRVVTIDGKLIEASGTMQGGGKSVRKGLMRLSVSMARCRNVLVVACTRNLGRSFTKLFSLIPLYQFRAIIRSIAELQEKLVIECSIR